MFKNLLAVCGLAVVLCLGFFRAEAEHIPEPKPVIDCRATLESWGNPPNCYCPCDTCHPVCEESEKPDDPDKRQDSFLDSKMFYAENEKKTFICYWQAECFRGAGHAITDGSTFGSFSNIDEAKQECMRDAQRGTRGYGGHCDIRCNCWASGSEPVFIPQ